VVRLRTSLVAAALSLAPLWPPPASPRPIAQDAGANLRGQAVFRSNTDLVTVPAIVSGRGETIDAGELGPSDFRVYEDGVLQQVVLVSREPRPLSVCILLDSSPSMASGRQPIAMRAVDALLSGLTAGDEATLLLFASTIRTLFPWTSATDLQPVSWIEWRLSLGTALVDALTAGLAQLDRARNPLPVIIVVSDGVENASSRPLSALVATRRQSEALVYGIQTDLPPSRFAPPINRAFANILPRLVADSGGTVTRVQSPEAAETAARALLAELRSLYVIGYEPTRAFDGKYRAIEVKAVNPRLTVRHRAGYLAVQRP
jgi:VWFA-related protein